jgi:serine/threonine-protein kinase
MTAPNSVSVNQLIVEWRDRLRRGERPGMEEYLARYPELADEIREVFPAVAMLEDLKGDAVDLTGTGAYDGRRLEAGRLERVGDYRILREVGRGGMGVVYEAEQESLGRRVALKVLPAQSLLDPRQQQRFLREAKAAARLHHTNIVPVFGVGEDAGVLYYVMQFITGLGLDEVLAELKRLRAQRTAGQTPATRSLPEPGPDLSAVDVARSLLTGAFAAPPAPEVSSGGSGRAEAGGDGTVTRLSASPLPSTERPPVPDASGRPDGAARTPLPGQTTLTESGRHYWQSVARIGVQVAEALEYAASQGILHRDIKPSNLLLDTQGNVWVTDFGLAKAGADQENLTHTGDIVGTLRYMAPERFQGKSDVRGDIYSLGLTLYELLIQQPAFGETDRSRLIHQVTHEEPVPPRKVNANVPRDLETIVLKAIARDPAHRYSKPAELAEDLRRFLEDKPIRARRASAGERLWRWCRRNPVVAGLTAGVAALLVVIAAGSALMAIHFRRLADEESVARRQAEAARKSEGEQRAQAEAAHAAAEKARTNETRQRKKAERALAIAEKARKSEATQRLKADRSRREAVRQQRLAQDNFRRARQAVDDYLSAVSESQLLRVPGMQPLRRKLLESALKYYEEFARQRADDPALQQDLALAYTRMARITAEIGDQPAEALAIYDRALAIRKKLQAAEPKSEARQLDLAEVYQAIGNLHRESGDTRTALTFLDRAYNTLLAVSPQNPNRRQRVTGPTGTSTTGIRVHESANLDILTRFFHVLNDRGAASLQAGDFEATEHRFYEALYIQQKLVQDFPKHERIVAFRHGLAGQWSRLGRLYAQIGLTVEGLIYHREAQSIWKGLLAQHSGPEQAQDFRPDLASSYEADGSLLARLGRSRAALDAYRQALALRERLARTNPAVVHYQADLAMAYFHLGSLEATAGQPEESLASLQKAVERQRQLVETVAGVTDYSRKLSRMLGRLAAVQGQLGRYAEALPTAREASTLLEKLPPKEASDWYELALRRATCSRLASRGKKKPTAEEKAEGQREADRAIEALAKAVAAGFQDLDRLQKDEELAPLRNRKDFQALRAEVQKRAKILEWMDDLEAAKARAVREKKDLFIWFGGSDWAAIAVIFRRTVLGKEAFFDYTTRHFILVDLDNPRYGPRPKNYRATVQLAAQWSVSRYPWVFLADARGRRYASLGGANRKGVDAYLKKLEEFRQLRVRRDQLLVEAAAHQGPEKARRLDRALQLVPPALATDYADLVEEILRLDPEDQAGLRARYLPLAVGARVARARAFSFKKDWAAALDTLNTTLDELRPTGGSLMQVLYLRANARAQRGRFDEAAADYARAAGLAPQNAATWHYWAVALAAAGREDEYRRLCARMLDRFAGTPAQIGTLVQVHTLLPAAVPDYTQLLRLAEAMPAGGVPEGYSRARLRGRLLYRAGRFEEAIQQLEEAVKLGPKQGPFYRNYLPADLTVLALAHQRLGHAAQARQYLARADEEFLQRAPRLAGDLAQARTWNSWANQVIESLLREEAAALIAGSPPSADPERRRALARAQARLGNWEQALADYDQVIAHQPAAARDYAERGRCREKLGQGAEAGADFSRAITLLEKQVAADRAQLAQKSKDRERRAALAVAQDRLATLYAHQTRLPEAAEALVAVSRLWPQDGTRRYDLARRIAALLARARPADRKPLAHRAVEVLRQAVAAGFDDAQPLAQDAEWARLRPRADFRALETVLRARNRFSLPGGEALRLSGHARDQWVMSVAADQRGRRALSGGMDRTVILWDLVRGREILRLQGIHDAIYGVALSLDGRQALVAGQDPAVRLYDLATGRVVRRLVGHQGWVASIRLLPGGRRALSGGEDGRLILWDLETGQVVRKFVLPEAHPIRDVVVSPNGRQALLAADNGVVQLWDLSDGKLIHRLGGHADGVWSVAFAPNGRQAVSGAAGGVAILWDLDKGKEIHRLAHGGAIRDVAFTADGRRVITAGPTGGLKLWDATTGQQLPYFTGTVPAIRLALTPAGRILTAEWAGRVRLWELTPEAERLAYFLQEKRLDRAALEYTARLKHRPDSASLRLARGQLYGRQGEWAKAAADLSVALEHDSADPPAWADLGRCRAMQGQWEEAATAYVRALDLLAAHPGRVAERRELAGELSLWSPVLAAVVKGRPKDAELWLAAGRQLAAQGQQTEADAAYAQAVALVPDELNRFIEAGWWVVGPYPQRSDTPCPPEKDPDPSRPVASFEGGPELPWRAARTGDYGKVDLRAVFQADHMAAYALTHVYSPEERTITLLVGGDDLVRLWLNGRLIHEVSKAQADGVLNLHRVPVTLRRGRNTVLARVNQITMTHHLWLRIADGPLDRAIMWARGSRWNEGAADVTRFFAHTRSAEYHDRDIWWRYLRLLQLSGDDAAARRLGERLFEHFGGTKDKAAAWYLATALNYVPGAAADTARLVELAELGATVNPQEKWRGLEVGLALYRASRYEEAIRRITEAVDLNSTYKAWPLLALAHHRLGHAAPARRWLDRARDWFHEQVKDPLALIRSDPTWGWAQRGEFLLLYREARHLIEGPGKDVDFRALQAGSQNWLKPLDPAMAAYDRALLLQPDRPRLWAARGRRQVESKRSDRAASDFAEALHLALEKGMPRSDRFRLAAELAREPASPAEAVAWDRAFTLAAQKYPRDWNYWVAAGQHFAQAGKPDQADAAYRRAMALTPDELNHFIEAGWWVAGTYPQDFHIPCPPEKDPDPSRPAAGLDGKGELPWHLTSTGNHGRVPLRQRFDADHVSAYALTYVYAPKEKTATLLVGADDAVRVWLNGRLVHQVSSYKAWPWDLERVPVTLRAGKNVLLARVTNFIGDYALVLRLADGPIDRGISRAEMGQWKDAALLFEKGFAGTLPEEAHPRILYALLLRAAGDTEKCRRHCAQAMQRLGTNLGADQGAEVAHICNLAPEAVKDFPGAVKAMEAWVRSARDGFSLRSLALAHYRAGQTEEALERIRECVKISGDWPLNWDVQALIYHRAGRKEEARKWLKKSKDWYAQVTREALARPVFGLPVGWVDWVQFVPFHHEALAVIEGTAVKDDPVQTAFAARAREDLRRRDPATAAFDHALLMRPDQPYLWLASARRHAELKRWDRAASDFLKALSLAPAARDPWWTSDIGAEEELARLDEVFTRAVKQRPKDRRLLIARVRGFGTVHRWREAAAALDKVIELDPSDHWAWFAAAALRLELGDKEGYRRACEEMITRFGKAKKMQVAERTAKACLLIPGAVADLGPVGELAHRAVTRTEEDGDYRWFLLTCGMAEYRAGRFAEALPLLRRSLSPGAEVRNRDELACLFLAMSYQRLGRAGEARAALERGRMLHERMVPKVEAGRLFDADWENELIFERIRREAAGEVKEGKK